MRTPGPSLKQSDPQSLPSVTNGDSGPGFCHHWASWRWVSGESALECLLCSGQLNPKGKQRPGSCWRRPSYSPEPRSRARSAWKCAGAGGGFVFLFLRFFFLMWTIFKVFIEFVTILFLFYVLVFWPQIMWDLSSSTRDQTFTHCIGRRSLKKWTTREALGQVVLEKTPSSWPSFCTHRL